MYFLRYFTCCESNNETKFNSGSEYSNDIQNINTFYYSSAGKVENSVQEPMLRESKKKWQ